jgi:sulfate/thiosulfate transport system substrate-binding protein
MRLGRGRVWTYGFPVLVMVLSFAAMGCDSAAGGDRASVTLLNVSYDPTRELYRAYNQAFAQEWKERTGQTVAIQQSHGGSGSQARAVIDGLDADVVTLALALDVDAIAGQANLLSTDWQGTLPHNNAPYTSTVVFLVRRGNPKNIRDWSDLVRPGVQVIPANPKTSGVARWNYLAAWGYALRQHLGEDFVAKLNDPSESEAVAAAEREAEAFVAALYGNVPVLDRAAREATNTFIQRRIGDVMLNWENEALLGAAELDEAGVEIVVPPVSILAEPVVAIVDRNVDRKGTREVAQAYLEYLYSDAGQELAGRNYYRPVDAAAQEKYAYQFPETELFTIDDVFGGWREANARHFADGAVFDRIYRPR